MARDKRTSVHFDREKRQFVGLDDANLKQLKEAYPGIDVDGELRQMGFWLTSSKGVKRKGNIGFIINWLNNATPREALTSELNEQETPLRPYIDEYLKDLWKGREFLLEMNQRKKKK